MTLSRAEQAFVANADLSSLNSFHSYAHTSLPWPELDPKALVGLPGDIVRLIAPHTEADPVALLTQLLATFGIAVGRRPFFTVEQDEHRMNLFVCLVGRTSKGRKGTAAGYVHQLFTWPACPDMGADEAVTIPINKGLASGEGLIWQVRDAITKHHPVKEKGRVVDYQDIIEDPGVRDKRLLVIEAEFARTLRVLGRDGNTLSAVIREAWDTGDLMNMTRHSPARATGAHIGIVGHITLDELRRSLTDTEAANGFGNRFLWCCVKRTKSLPEGGNLDAIDFAAVKRRLKAALTAAQGVTKLSRSPAARELWCARYDALSAEMPGLLGALTARAEAQVLRLSCLYALFDGSAAIDVTHLEAALAVWAYAEASARYVFGATLGDPLADELLRLLRLASENGMTRTEISNAFGRNRKAHEIGLALERLVQQQLARCASQPTEGRTAQVWYAVMPPQSPEQTN